MVAILAAARTPIGSLGGKLKYHDAPSLAAAALRGAMRQARVRMEEIDEAVFSLGVCAGAGVNPGLHALLEAEAAPTCRAITVVGGVHAVNIGVDAIRSGRASVVAVAGMESVSLAPHMFRGEARRGLGELQMLDTLECDAGARIEVLRHESMEEDEYVLLSHKRARDAWGNGSFDSEVITDLNLKQDEATLKEEAVSTVGARAPLGDGAACVIMCSEEFAAKQYLMPLATVTDTFFTAGPHAVEQVVRECWKKKRHVDFYEFPDIRAMDILALTQTLKIDLSRVNVHGGALSLGWSPGMDGVRRLCTLIHTLHQARADSGLCVSASTAAQVARREREPALPVQVAGIVLKGRE